MDTSITAARSLTGLWNEARLRADEARSTSVRPAPGAVSWRAALEDVLNVGYGLQTQCRFVAGGWEQVRWRTTPSAGALYPFEVIACIPGEGSYLWDVRAGRLLDCGLPALGHDELAGADLVIGAGEHPQVLLVVLARPWTSMKKYRLRGYQYCHLDVGHVTTNLATYSAALGYAPTLHLRFSRTWLAEHLRLEGLCREPVAVLSFARAEPIRRPEPGGAIEPAISPHLSGLDLPEASELENWEALKGVLSYEAAIEPPCAPARTALVSEPMAVREDRVVLLPDGNPSALAPAEWRSAILARRSAKGFQDRSLGIGQLGTLLGALRAQGMQADCSLDEASRLGVSVIARNIDGVAGVFAYTPGRHALYEVDDTVDEFRPACMKQPVAHGAAALLLFHAAMPRLLDGYSAFAELHFHAAQLGQRLHLAATRLGIGMTCLGGFDGERCAALARLGAAREAIYVILLGVADDSAIKHDRHRVAYSHGYKTEEG